MLRYKLIKVAVLALEVKKKKKNKGKIAKAATD